MVDHYQEDEIVQLVDRIGGKSATPTESATTRSSRLLGTLPSKILVLLFLSIAFIAKVVFLSDRDLVPFTTPNEKDEIELQASRVHTPNGNQSLPELSCPSSIDKSKNDEDVKFYDETPGENKTWTAEELDALKKITVDGWGTPFYELKRRKKDWTVRRYSSLESGDTIFESGCGIGSNLLLKVEILKENLGIENLNIYGIDYRQGPVGFANNLLGQTLPDLGSKLGSPICRGDATNLFFIPSESFDLSYTGYIDPVIDPLNIKQELGRVVEADDICDSEGNWAVSKLAKLEQEAQENWYAAWTTELVRITKRGKPIIIEDVSLPLCDSRDDWGGVSKEWWRLAASKYNWDVNVESIQMEAAHKRANYARYNVYMRKNE